MRIGLGTLVGGCPSAGGLPAMAAEEPVAVPPQITTPDRVDTILGTLEFDDGVPSEDTAQKDYDQIDLHRGVDVFLNSFRGVSTYAARKGIRDAGAKDNEVSYLLRAHGRELAVPDRQRRHGLLPRRSTSPTARW